MSDLSPFATATAMCAALRERQVSSLELTDMHIRRIEALDGPLNAIPVRTFERARAMAKAADQQLAAGVTAPLLGLPMTLKESTLVAGLPQTAGLPAFAGYTPPQDGPLAHQVFAAGAALLGKTNIPTALGDWQADSPVYGRTNNPWDLSRTPGGSTGGGGAALAAGLTPLELGSDIGGSIRVPAAYCGCYGHRPSETAIPRSGGFPMADLPNPAVLMPVQGPLARSAQDLELLFDVLAGPEPGEDAAWRLQLPASRQQQLAGFRVALCPELPGARVAAAVRERQEQLVTFLVGEGVQVEEVALPFDFEAYFMDYLRLLHAVISQGTSLEARQATAAQHRAAGDPISLATADGLLLGAQEFMQLAGRRAQMQQHWAQFFTRHDLLLAPQTLDVAFPHETRAYPERTLLVDNEEVPYFSNIIHSMLAIFTGLPSTCFPAGLSPAGLPVGLQAIGPYLEDRTPLGFARLLEQQWQGFQTPPGYS